MEPWRRLGLHFPMPPMLAGVMSSLSIAGVGPASQAWVENRSAMPRKDVLLRVPSQTQGIELWSSHWQATPGHRIRPTRRGHLLGPRSSALHDTDGHICPKIDPYPQAFEPNAAVVRM